MEPQNESSSSLTAPLIVDHDPQQHRVGSCKLEEDVESKYNNHLNTSSSTSTYKTILHKLNALSGIEILSIPYAISSGGRLSLALLFVIAIAAFYSGLLIQKCMDFDPNIKTYSDIGSKAFGNKGRTLVSVFIYAELYFVPIGFLILEGDNLQNLFPNIGIEDAGLNIGGRQGFVLIVGLIILPTLLLSFYHLMELDSMKKENS